MHHFGTKARGAGTSGVAWARTHKLLAALIPVLVIVLAAGAAVAASGGGGKAGTTASSGNGTDSSAASSGAAKSSAAKSSAGKGSAGKSSGSSHGGGSLTVGKQVHVPTQPAVTKGEKWITGPAGQLLSTVNTDVGKISADQRAGNRDAVKDLGALLTADAKAALDGPMPPVRSAVYRAALEDFEQIGKDAVSGNFSKTSSLLTTANLDIMSVTTAANVAAPVSSAAQVSDPSDG